MSCHIILMFTASWVSPRYVVDNYSRVVSSLADNIISVTRLVNNAIFANLEAFKTCVQNARDNVKEFSRIRVNSTKTFEKVSKDTTANISLLFSYFLFIIFIRNLIGPVRSDFGSFSLVILEHWYQVISR